MTQFVEKLRGLSPKEIVESIACACRANELVAYLVDASYYSATFVFSDEGRREFAVVRFALGKPVNQSVTPVLVALEDVCALARRLRAACREDGRQVSSAIVMPYDGSDAARLQSWCDDRSVLWIAHSADSALSDCSAAELAWRFRALFVKNS